MAAVTRVKARPCTPVGYERVRDADSSFVMAQDASAGQLVSYTGGGWDLTAATALFAHGILLKNCLLGMVPEIGIVGEMDGFSGMTPYTDLYVSGTVDGGLDTTKPSGGVLQVRAVSATRIAYDFGP